MLQIWAQNRNPPLNLGHLLVQLDYIQQPPYLCIVTLQESHHHAFISLFIIFVDSNYFAIENVDAPIRSTLVLIAEQHEHNQSISGELRIENSIVCVCVCVFFLQLETYFLKIGKKTALK